ELARIGRIQELDANPLAEIDRVAGRERADDRAGVGSDLLERGEPLPLRGEPHGPELPRRERTGDEMQTALVIPVAVACDDRVDARDLRGPKIRRDHSLSDVELGTGEPAAVDH